MEANHINTLSLFLNILASLNVAPDRWNRLPSVPNLSQNSQRNPGQRAGAALENQGLSQDLFGVQMAELTSLSVPEPFGPLKTAMVDRGELLKYEICSLPQGFEDLKQLVCLEAVD